MSGIRMAFWLIHEICDSPNEAFGRGIHNEMYVFLGSYCMDLI